ncbi:helix-turn-helix domain-containing GNAT family N-acetyltransferase [Nocardioides marinquilinus]|uniref:Helix-turn-helix domain-containing GNAT family N-acetyltransferase n=1 Tax=Nocardioides marinquilinus TaxID=1210400 RepID=A0ABP9Q3U4_9ACTN
MTTTEHIVRTVRTFNRTYTQRIGALEESFLGLGLPLGAARIVFEVGTTGGDGPDSPDGARVGDLRDRLGLDSGHLSRQLRRLEADGLVAVAPDPRDRRARLVTLTASGRDLLARLEERSDDAARRLVVPLTERQRTRLAEALATADLLVRAATVELTEVDPGGALAIRAMRAYFVELDARFPSGFDPGTAPLLETFTVATSDGQVVACGGVQGLDGGPAGEPADEIKRMWVHPGWRGAGLGTRLLRHLEDVVRARGRGVVRLDTNGTLAEAIAMYERAGYRRVERYNDNPYAELFFEKRLD